MRAMSIGDSYGRGNPVISFEFFPPKTDAGFRSLFGSIEELKQLAPGFVSVTMGAGGSTRAKTVDLVIEIQREIGLQGMAHLPCLGFRPGDVAGVLDALVAGGVDNVLALRGDMPKDTEGFVHPDDGFDHANELVAFVRARGGFSIGAACYPEKHPEAPDAETDLAQRALHFFDFRWKRNTQPRIAVIAILGRSDRRAARNAPSQRILERGADFGAGQRRFSSIGLDQVVGLSQLFFGTARERDQGECDKQ